MIKKYEDYIKEAYVSEDDEYCEECGELMTDDPNVARQCECESSDDYVSKEDEYCDECGELITNDPNVARQCECNFNESKILKFSNFND